MGNDFLVPAQGDIIVSPTANGYYDGEPLKVFLAACFKSRIQGKTSNIIDIYVGGHFTALNSYAFLDVTNVGKGKANKKYIPHFSSRTPENAQVLGEKVTSNWISQNAHAICQAAHKAVESEGLKTVDNNQRIAINLPGGIEAFKNYISTSVEVSNPHLIVNVFSSATLVKQKEDEYISKLAEAVFYVNQGKKILREAQDRNVYLAGSSLTQDILKELEPYLTLEDILSIQDMPAEFLCKAIGIEFSKFQKALEKEETKWLLNKDNILKATVAYTKTIAIACPFFTRKTLSTLNKPFLAEYRNQISKDDLKNVLTGCEMYAIAGDAVYFQLFENNLLYANPEEIDKTQTLCSDMGEILFNKPLSFPVQVKEKETSASPGLQQKRNLSLEESQLLDVAIYSCTKGELSTDAFFLLLEKLAQNTQSQQKSVAAAPSNITNGLFNQAPIAVGKNKRKVSFASSGSSETISGSIQNDSTDSTPASSPENSSVLHNGNSTGASSSSFSLTTK